MGGTGRSRCIRCASRCAGCARRSRCSAVPCAAPAVTATDTGLKALGREIGAHARLGRVRDRDRRRGRRRVSRGAADAAAARRGGTTAPAHLPRRVARLPRQRRVPPPRGSSLPASPAEQDRRATLDDAEQTELAAPLEAFAADVLSKRLKRLVQIDDDIAGLEPAALHAIRLRAKRLRYAAEIFAPLYPGKADASLHSPAEPAAGSAGHTERRRGRRAPARRDHRRQPRVRHRPGPGLRRRAQRPTRASGSTRHGRSSIAWSRSGGEGSRVRPLAGRNRRATTGRRAAVRIGPKTPRRPHGSCRRRPPSVVQQLEARQRP